MSRGGRGGGRGGFGGAKRPQAPGSEFSFGPEAGEPTGISDYAPMPLFPDYNIPTPKPLSSMERRQISCYRALREKFHDGPYYTKGVFGGEDGAKSRGEKDAVKGVDVFTMGMPTYGQRYRKKVRTLPVLKGGDYAMHFFPQELWSVVETKTNANTTTGPRGKKRRLDATELSDGPGRTRTKTAHEDEDEAAKEARKRLVLGLSDDEDADNLEDEEDDDEVVSRKRKGKKEKSTLFVNDDDDADDDVDDDPGEGSNAAEDEEEGEEELEDDDFSEDEDDFANDYNAEQYFDGGDDDDGGDADGENDRNVF